METILKVAIGVFAGLALWSAKDSLGSMLLVVAVLILLLFLLIWLWSSIKNLISYFNTRIFVIRKIYKFIVTNNLVQDRERVFIDGAIFEFRDDPRLHTLLQKVHQVSEWNKKGMSTPQEHQEISVLVAELIADYKETIKRKFAPSH